MALSAIILYSYKKKNLRVTVEVNQINCQVWFFFFFHFFVLKTVCGKITRIFQPAVISRSNLLTTSQLCANGFCRPVETFLNHRKRRGNGSRTDRASLPTATFLDDGAACLAARLATRRSRITCDLDVHVSVQQQVLRLEIPVDDVAVVAVLHRRQDLPELPPGLDLAQPPVLRQVVCGRTVEKKQEVISCGVASSGGLCISYPE